MKTLTTLLCLAALTLSESALAQQPAAPALSTGGRWDASGQIALLNRHRSDLSRWDRWYSAPAVDGTAGRYWTPHFKTEFEIATARRGGIDVEESTFVPGSPIVFPHYREHALQETMLGATAMYQFFENQWVHPFVGVGAELVRERDRADAFPPITIRPTPATSLIVPALPAIDKVSYSVRPLVTGGFKFYVSPRAFVRTEVRTALSTDRGLALQWRGGIGFDF